MKSRLEERNLFLFLAKDKRECYFCRSFFPESNMDYTKKQASWTLLYKKKITISTKQEKVLYNALKVPDNSI